MRPAPKSEAAHANYANPSVHSSYILYSNNEFIAGKGGRGVKKVRAH